MGGLKGDGVREGGGEGVRERGVKQYNEITK